MRKFTIALDKDINKQYNDAAIYYQKSIDEGEINLETFLNLSFLYWNFQDFGFFSYYKISEELRNIGYDKYPEILDIGLSKFPNNLELNFWKKYFQHIIYGDEFSEKDCENLLKEYGDSESIVPYFFLYLFDKEKYKQKRNELLALCKKKPTAKNLYIKSIVG
ncbi:hypothetical protein E6C50_14435 [Flavobacterium supellecticarium]|uniref:Uncharacterized protein n=1 Tax=Flavobacterium supellecticarium TaxID=2565924 RepID=A0A4S3ZS47_9FLAO|nr:hypothetical protein [Flavobacterium supellecticarium]THF48478.1 hypothetical protein E6C50_14435 [Flavobacterium supellecticarium]HRB70536.1 hypothetical protein [Flavobacterium sp.]